MKQASQDISSKFFLKAFKIMKSKKPKIVQFFEADKEGFRDELNHRISTNELAPAYRDIFDILYYYYIQNQNYLHEIFNEPIKSFKMLVDIDKLFSFISPATNKEQFLEENIQFPPYDLFIICALLSLEGNEVDVQNRFFCLFRFHAQMLSILKKKEAENPNQKVWLNDWFEPVQKNINEVIKIENTRVLYISELLIILYHSMPPNQLLGNFVDTYFYQNDIIEPSDEIFSVIGRIILSTGDLEKSQDFFSKVHDEHFKKMNEAFILFFQCKYNEAEKSFKEIDDPIAKVNRATALVFLGKIEQAKSELESAIQQEKSLLLLKSVSDNRAFINELSPIKDYHCKQDLINFPSNALSVRIPH